MKTQKLEILILFLCIFGFIGCDNKDEEGEKVTDYKEYSLTIASKKIPGVCWSDGFNYLSDVYAVKKENAQEWESLGVIDKFEFEKGYEYKVKISETNYLDYSMENPAWTEYELLEIISKNRKDSENLPLHFIPKSYYENVQLPKYKYVVDADNNQKLIEEELEKAKKAIKTLGGKIEKVDKFEIPESDLGRSIIIVKKEKITPSKFPRKPGTPAKEPL